MKKLILSTLIIASTCFIPAANAELTLDEIDFVKKTATEVCLSANEIKSYRVAVEAEAAVKAKINLYIVKLGAGARAKVEAEISKGLTSKMLKYLKEDHFEINGCEIKLFELMIPALAQSPKAPMSQQVVRKLS